MLLFLPTWQVISGRKISETQTILFAQETHTQCSFRSGAKINWWSLKENALQRLQTNETLSELLPKELQQTHK